MKLSANFLSYGNFFHKTLYLEGITSILHLSVQEV